MSITDADDIRARVLSGIALTSVAYFLFSLQDAAIKLLVVGFSVWQILLFRSITILAALGATGGRKLFAETARSPIVAPMLGRSFIILAAWLCYYSASRDLQLAELTTIYFAAPVIVTVLSVLILGEIVPFSRWAAVFIGFAGVYIACDPATIGLTRPVLLVLSAAFLWALSIVLLRKIALREKTTIQLVLNNAFFLLTAGLPMFWLWVTPSAGQFALLAGVGAIGGLAQFSLFEGMKRAPASVIAPFEYTALIWAFVLGWLIWRDVPREAVVWGAGLIALAGILIVAGERQRKPKV